MKMININNCKNIIFVENLESIYSIDSKYLYGKLAETTAIIVEKCENLKFLIFSGKTKQLYFGENLIGNKSSTLLLQSSAKEFELSAERFKTKMERPPFSKLSIQSPYFENYETGETWRNTFENRLNKIVEARVFLKKEKNNE